MKLGRKYNRREYINSFDISLFVYSKLIKATVMLDGITCMAFTVSFVPNTGNKYFIAACDEQLKLFDFEQAMASIVNTYINLLLY